MNDRDEFNEMLEAFVRGTAGPPEAADRMVKWGKQEEDISSFTIWDELPGMDWSDDLDFIDGLFKTALQGVAREKKIDLIEVRLGESPELFQVAGSPLLKGQDGVDGFVKTYKKHDNWYKLVDDNSENEFCFERLENFPGALWNDIWKMVYEGDESDRMDEEAAWGIWVAFATLAVANSIRRGDVNYQEIVGDHRRIPIVISSGDSDFYIGMITAEGWRPDFD